MITNIDLEKRTARMAELENLELIAEEARDWTTLAEIIHEREELGRLTWRFIPRGAGIFPTSYHTSHNRYHVGDGSTEQIFQDIVLTGLPLTINRYDWSDLGMAMLRNLANLYGVELIVEGD